MRAKKPNPARRRSAKGNRLLPLAALLMALAVVVAAMELFLPQGSPLRALPGMGALYRLGDTAAAKAARAFTAGGGDSSSSSRAGSADVPTAASSPAPAVSAASSGGGEDAQAQTVVYVGDSFTGGIGLYHLQGAGTVISDAGLSAYKAAKGQITWQGRSVSVAEAVAALHPTKIYLQLGSNDVTWVSPAAFTQYYGQLLDALRAGNGGAAVYVESVFPVTAAYETGGKAVNSRIAAFNAQLVQLARQKDARYVDVASALAGGDGKLSARLSSDGLHLNRAGYQKWMGCLNAAG